MFGSMEMMELLQQSNNVIEYHYGIVPTVLLPLAFLSTGISILATYVAGFFGIKLKAEGPRKLLELLLRPKLLISAMFLNVLIYAGFHFYAHVKNGPVPLVVQSTLSKTFATPSSKVSLKDGIKVIDINEPVFAKGTIVEGKLYVGTTSGNLLKIELKRGSIEKRFYVGKFVSPTPVFFDGYLYFGEGLHQSHHMGVYKFDLKEFSVATKFETQGHTEIFPVIHNNILYQAAGGDGLYAIDIETMQKKWHFSGGHMDGYVGILENALFVGTGVPVEDNDKVRPMAYRLHSETGEIAWQRELPLSTWYGPAISNDHICFPLGEIHVESKLGGISCFSPSGERQSTILIDAPVLSKPIILGDNIIFNDYHGGLYSWKVDGSRENWKIKATSKAHGYSSSVLIDNNIYFVDADGTLKIVNPITGVFLERDLSKILKPGERVYADILKYDEKIYIFGMKGSILELDKSMGSVKN
ncbi:PQQ-binding-like beta-propeller repeat protein [Bacteriovorax sp. Seq25_V]|uniref:outer membrane protein assembly factor BamB family protein n=1 Tax=Bacteriovorax sp. Seq25_V TaxID=1201288 RepID=UPI000389E160|nr:PQQ-binding-like beta-propeller repeat protein [Bacteriovorax sp. Seq25_V]EQC43921.1 PQQ-like domain protein [Bacteriovorax sp. Seq25_V]